MSAPLRLCYVGWGDHVHVERWAGYFARAGHKVGVLSFSGLGQYPQGVQQYRVGPESLDGRLRALRMKLNLWRLRPQLVHVHWAHFAHSAVQVWGGPLVVSAWGSDIYRVSEKPPVRLDRLRASLPCAGAITCDSEDLAAEIARLVPETADRINVIQWGVDTEHFRPQAADTASVLGFETGARPVILSPRNFNPLYNLEAIVRAFARVLIPFPDALLVLKDYNGDAGYKEQVLALVERLGITQSVRVVGSTRYDQMPSLYSAARVSVSVPFSDATPMSLLEAMACGSFPIASNLPSIREWIEHGVNGLLVDPTDELGLADHIVHVLGNPELLRESAATNRAIVEQRASQHVHMERMAGVYRSLVSGVRARSAGTA